MEENLVEQITKKNSKALDFLVDSYGNLLHKVIFSVLGPYGERGVKEECLNDVLLSIWDNIAMFSGSPEKFPHWICVIAKYKSIDYQRKLVKDKDHLNIDHCMIKADETIDSGLLAEENKDEFNAFY